jgi:hypothetical protein
VSLAVFVRFRWACIEKIAYASGARIDEAEEAQNNYFLGKMDVATATATRFERDKRDRHHKPAKQGTLSR